MAARTGLLGMDPSQNWMLVLAVCILKCVCVCVHVLFGLLSVIYLSGVIPMQLADISRGLA